MVVNQSIVLMVIMFPVIVILHFWIWLWLLSLLMKQTLNVMAAPSSGQTVYTGQAETDKNIQHYWNSTKTKWWLFKYRIRKISYKTSKCQRLFNKLEACFAVFAWLIIYFSYSSKILCSAENNHYQRDIIRMLLRLSIADEWSKCIPVHLLC